ncbi:hypothetical protein [Bacillus timonensis]|uniref:hypothetical protein n=1 Tax=Bacillus timonensis TaxID=1033734 RepID=UPI0002EC4F35|nr:hypothetical protein [Bacillus timonensis]
MICINLYQKSKRLALLDVEQQIELEVTLTDINLLNNQSVGNNWDTGVKVNDTFLPLGKTLNITTTINDSMDFVVGAREIDNIPDVGITTHTVEIKDLDLVEGNTLHMEVAVRENRGRYTGNYAYFEFLIRIQRKVKLVDIMNKITQIQVE